MLKMNWNLGRLLSRNAVIELRLPFHPTGWVSDYFKRGRRDMCEKCWNEAKAQILILISCHVSLSQGYQEHWGEAARPFEKNCLQHLGFEGPDQHPECVCCVILTRKRMGDQALKQAAHWTISWAGAELQGRLWIGKTKQKVPTFGAEWNRLTVHFYSSEICNKFLHVIQMGMEQTYSNRCIE